MKPINKRIELLAILTLGIGGLAGCEYSLYLLAASLPWLALSRARPAGLARQH